MHITCTKEKLEKAIQLVSRSADAKGSLPILSHILLETKSGLLRCSSTNLEIGTICQIGVHIEEEGRCAVPAKVLAEYIATLKSGKITLQATADEVTIKGKTLKTRIKGMPPDEFPLIPIIQASESVKINGQLLAEALSSVLFATSKDESRPEITGVYLKIKNNQGVVVATDGHRLAERKIAISNAEGEIDAIIPSKTVAELIRITAKREGDIEIGFQEGQVQFVFLHAGGENETIKITSKIISGSFPDYQQILPTDYQTAVTVSRSDFTTLIKGASLFSGAETNEVVVAYEKTKGELVLHSESAAIGENTGNITCEATGEDVRVGFNYYYLLDGVGAIDSKQLTISFAGEEGPAVMSSKENPEYVYVVMPLDTM